MTDYGKNPTTEMDGNYHMFADAGWPRPTAPFMVYDSKKDEEVEKKLPVPFVAGKRNGRLEWTSFWADMWKAAAAGKCQVCGEPLNWVKVLGRMSTNDGPRVALFGRDAGQPLPEQTSGPGMHPRCAAMAFQFCPHFSEGEDALVAAVYRGKGIGLRRTARYRHFEEEMQSGEPEISSAAKLQTRAQIKKLAKRNPMGEKGVR